MAIPAGHPVIREASVDWPGDFASAFDLAGRPEPGSAWQAYTPHNEAVDRIVQLADAITTDAMGYRVNLENQRDMQWLECLAASQRGIARGYKAGKALVEVLVNG